MRPNKPINSGSHRSGAAARQGKSRFFTTGLPDPPGDSTVSPPDSLETNETVGKYAGRASVSSRSADDRVPDRAEKTKDWVDPLDRNDLDLTTVTIDLREAMVDSPPDTYFQRHSSRVPGHQ